MGQGVNALELKRKMQLKHRENLEVKMTDMTDQQKEAYTKLKIN